MGYMAYDVEYWDPDFATIYPCPVCSGDKQAAWLLSMCGLTEEQQQIRIENTIRFDTHAKAYDGALRVIENPQWFYTLYGDNGVGKSWLLSMIVNECRLRGWISIYTTSAALLDYLRQAYDPDKPQVIDDRWNRLVTARVLAIDELDRFNPKPWALEKFFELTDTRYRNGSRLLTCFSTNKDIGELDGYLTSRMRSIDCQVHRITGPDLRRVAK